MLNRSIALFSQEINIGPFDCIFDGYDGYSKNCSYSTAGADISIMAKGMPPQTTYPHLSVLCPFHVCLLPEMKEFRVG